MAKGRSPEEMRRLRRAVFPRDHFRCRDCNRRFRRPSGWKGEGILGLTLGHVIPKSQGGRWQISNLIAQCDSCNNELDDEPWVPGWRVLRAMQEAEK